MITIMDTKQVTRQLEIEAKFFKGLADKSRLAILETLLEDEKTVAEIVKTTQLSQPNVSAHLACLLECGLVQKQRDSQWMLYRIASDEVPEIIRLMRQIVSAHSEELFDCTRYK